MKVSVLLLLVLSVPATAQITSARALGASSGLTAVQLNGT
jgi:hypothetical protein